MVNKQPSDFWFFKFHAVLQLFEANSVFCHDLLNKQIYVSQALVEGNTDIQRKQN